MPNDLGLIGGSPSSKSFAPTVAPMMDNKIARVVLWMVGALLSFSVMAVSIRELSRAGLNIFEILAIRSGVALLFLLTLLAVRPELRIYARPRRMGLHL